MKRILLLSSIIFLCLSLPCFSASVDVGADGKLTVQLKPTTDMSHYDFGFSSIPVLQWATKAIAPDETMALAPFMDPETGNFIATFDETRNQELFVYWRLYSLDTVELKLSIDGHMVNSVDRSDTLRWFINWFDDNAANNANATLKDAIASTPPKLDSNKANTPVLVKRCEKLLTLQPNAGCKQIYVFTDNLLNKSIVGVYNGSIVLTVEVVK